MWDTILSVVLTGLGVMAVGLGAKLWPYVKALLPGWAANLLVIMADVFVRWAESAYDGSPGPRKFEIVLGKLDAYLRSVGIAMETDIIRAAVEAAWEKMNTEQIAAGIKEVAGDAQ